MTAPSTESDQPTKASRLRGRHLAAHRHAEEVREVVKGQQQDNAVASLTVACPICGAAADAPCKPGDPRAYCYSRYLAATGISTPPGVEEVSRG